MTPQKNTEIFPLFKCDSSTLSFYASKDGKISMSFSGWEQNRVVLKGAKPLRRDWVLNGVAGPTAVKGPESGVRKGAVT